MLKLLLASLFLLPVGFAAGFRVQFDPRDPAIGPFPADFLTVPDAGQRTGLRVNLPLPNCQTLASDGGEITLINQLDGFNPNVRMTVRFSGPVGTSTLRKGLFYVWLDPLLPGRATLGPVGKFTAVKQVIWDPSPNTAYAKPDEVLEGARRYMIVVRVR